MATIYFKGDPIKTQGELPKIDQQAPDFTLTRNDLSDTFLRDFNKPVIMNVFLSLDTPVCAKSTRKFNEIAKDLTNTNILCISPDLPFAQSRFCANEGIENVITLSSFRHPEFAKQYGIAIAEGSLKGLLARSIFLLDKNHKVKYIELVKEVTDEPNYDEVLKHAKSLD